MSKVVVKQEPGNEVPAEIIAHAIVDIAKGMKALERTRLSRRAVVALIHEDSKVPRKTIEVVINNLIALEETWLKKKI